MSNPYQTITSRLRYARRLYYRGITSENRHVHQKVIQTLRKCGLPTDLNILVESKITLSRKPDLGKEKNEEYYGYKLESIAWPRELVMLNKTNYDQRRRVELVYRITLQLAKCLEEKRYTYWTTLTLDEAVTERSPESIREKFRLFTQNIRRRIGEKPNYVAVQEGEKTNPHIHVLWDVGSVPPTYNIQVVDKKEIRPFRILWPFGISQTIAARIGKHDKWNSERRITIEEAQKVLAAPQKIALYLAKYLSKETETIGRIRYSQGYGVWLINQTLEQMETRLLRPLETSLTWPEWNGRQDQMPPSSIITNYAKKERLRRILNSRPSSASTINLTRKQNVFYAIAGDFEKKTLTLSSGSLVRPDILDVVDSISPEYKRTLKAIYTFEHIYRIMGGIE